MNIEGLLNDDTLPAVPENLPKWDGTSIAAPQVGVFDGTWDAMKDILPNAALTTGSAATSVISQAGIESAAIEAQEIGVPIEDPTAFAKEQVERTAAVAKEWRRKAKEDYSPDPETTGVVAQVIHGIGTELTKAGMAAIVTGGNPGAASLLYGAQHGVETAQRYKDQGVDDETATNLGVGAFVAGTLGMRIPGALGSTRAVSALYGSVVNPIANISEDATIRTILDKSGYSALADKVDPFDPINLAVAAVVGGGFGALGYRARPDAEPQTSVEQANAETSTTAPSTGAQKKPAAEAVSKALKNSIVNADVSAIREASALRMSSAGVILQNRDRNTAKSIIQMQKIAANPIYTMVSVSRDFAQGAPAIGYAEIPQAQYGRYETVAASDGTMMEMRYAVIEADQVQTSNYVDGTRNQDYGTEARNLAIAGNGRIAGIAEAYRRGNADKYKADLVADADTVGIPREVIEKMQAPILVRVMRDKDASRPDIAKLSNETGTAGFDAAEQAENDAAAIDLASLTFDEEGNIMEQTVKEFAALVPDPSTIVDKLGRPNTFARPRLERAIFQRVFGDANLSSMLDDREVSGKTMVRILLQAAPKLMQLEGSPLDFRDDLKAAVNEVITAKASGSFRSIEAVARAEPKGRTPETSAFLDYFATVGGSKIKEPAKVFSDLADWVAANRESRMGLFADETPEATRVDLMMQFSQMTGVPVDPKLLDMVQKEVTHTQKVQQVHKTIADQLRSSGQPEEQIEAQATLWTNAAMRLAEQAHVDPMEILPRIKVSEEVPSGSLKQIIAASYSPDEVARAKPLVKRIVDRVVRGESTHGQGRDSFEDYLPVTDEAADEILKRTGHDVHGYVHSVTDSDLSHIRNRHGEGNEARDDQIPLDPDEYVRVPEVVTSPDDVKRGGLTKSSHLETIVYEKKFDDGVTIVVEEIRTGRRKLALRTAYKKIPSTPDVPESSDPRALRPGRSEAASSLEKSISQTSANVNEGELLQTAWHGSPYQFDSFSTDRIGTGTGNATHGWGLYFTNEREIARKYRDMTGPDGRVYEVDVPEDEVLLDTAATYDEQPQAVRDAIDRLYRDEYGTEPPPEWWTGREVYQDIILKEEGIFDPDDLPGDYEMDMDMDELAGDSRLASVKLNSIGVKGAKFEGDDGDTGFVVFDDNAIKILDFYQRNNAESFGSYSPAENRITLTPNANITTFSHEMGHFWLTNAIEFSKSNHTDKSLRQDVRKLFDVWGIKDQAHWDELGVEGQRRYHEQFASWVEEYLSTGRAPTPTLQGLFEKFREWITALYRDVRAHLEGRYRSEFGDDLPPLSAEVRDILDRNLAYEDAMRAARDDFSVTHAQADSARYANFERIKREDQMTDQTDAQQTQASLLEEFKAAEALNNGDLVEVSAPVDVERAAGQKKLIEDQLGFPETLAPKVQPADMPVHQIPQSGIISDGSLELPSGKDPEQVAAAREGAEIVLENPDMLVETANGESITARELIEQTEAQAREVDAFAGILQKASQCIVNNGGI